jgi:hypothetical protein
VLQGRHQSLCSPDLFIMYLTEYASSGRTFLRRFARLTRTICIGMDIGCVFHVVGA